ncbi:SLAM family member 9-like isoform X2 [Xenopus tropicalis]|uniref:SLAM family member 9-like isoform X2 n=1 Tax=Xenopus tropicalis TaxID=8364 RepID=A0A8J1ITW5_XENTR|nr:SLAM family member 9-like isoform X2 [Xenopus tropicalis]
MLFLCSWSLLILSLHKSVTAELACKATETVAAIEGEEAILQVNRTGITEISWIFKGRHIATTRPNQTIEWKNRQFMTRLGSKPDASLIINKTTGGDQGIYTADMRGLSEADDLIQCYNLSVYRRLKDEDISIRHTVHVSAAGDTPCHITVTCTEEGESTAKWTDSYNKLIEGSNHTIHIYNVTLDLSYNCSLANPVSKVSKTVNVWALCNEGKRNMVALITGLLVGLLVVIGCLCSVYYLTKKTRTLRFRDKANGFPVNDTTELTNVPAENPYSEIQDPPPVPMEKPRQQQNDPLYDTIK